MNKLRDDPRTWPVAAGLVVTAAFMVALFAAGFMVIGRAILWFFYRGTGHDSAGASDIVLVGVLQGVEYLSVAPLPFLLFQTLVEFVKSSRPGGPTEAAERELLRIKTLTIGLMVSVVATELVAEILGRHATIPAAVPPTMAIAALTAYLVALHWSHRT
jgi:hypothetical protein